MKTEVEIKDIFFKVLKDSALAKTISGSIYTDGRPSVIDNPKEDIIISINDNNNTEDKQSVILYVNIYVKDIKRGADLIQDKKRIRLLSRLAIDILEDGITSDYTYKLTKQKTFSEETNEHCISNRLKITHLNY